MRSVLGLCLLLLSVGAPLHAQGVALVGRAGTAGFGGGLAVGVLSTLNVRVEASYYSYERDDLELEGSYRADITADGRLMLGSLLADWHPLGGAFRFSVGAVYNGIEGSGTIIPRESVTMASRTYAPEEIGDLAIDIRPGTTIAPYGGIGFGNANTGRVGLLFDLGVVYLGASEVDLTATGLLAPMAREADQIEENLGWIQVYPVIAIGLSVRPF